MENMDVLAIVSMLYVGVTVCMCNEDVSGSCYQPPAKTYRIPYEEIIDQKVLESINENAHDNISRVLGESAHTPQDHTDHNEDVLAQSSSYRHILCAPVASNGYQSEIPMLSMMEQDALDTIDRDARRNMAIRANAPYDGNLVCKRLRVYHEDEKHAMPTSDKPIQGVFRLQTSRREYTTANERENYVILSYSRGHMKREYRDRPHLTEFDHIPCNIENGQWVAYCPIKNNCFKACHKNFHGAKSSVSRHENEFHARRISYLCLQCGEMCFSSSSAYGHSLKHDGYVRRKGRKRKRS